MVSKIQRDDSDDTGEQDVRELRARFANGAGAPVVEEDGISDDDIEQTLLRMVEEGTLCFGWIPERQEFGFWPASESQPIQRSERQEPIKHRRAPRKPAVMRRVVCTLAVVLATPVVGFTVSQAQDATRVTPRQDNADLTSSESEAPAAKPEVSVPKENPAVAKRVPATPAPQQEPQQTEKPESLGGTVHHDGQYVGAVHEGQQLGRHRREGQLTVESAPTGEEPTHQGRHRRYDEESRSDHQTPRVISPERVVTEILDSVTTLVK